MKTIRIASAALTAGMLLLAVLPVAAQEAAPPAAPPPLPDNVRPWDKSDGAKVIQVRRFEKSQRHALSLLVGLVPTDEQQWYFPMGLRYGFLATETLAVEVEGAYLVTKEKPWKDQMESRIREEVTGIDATKSLDPLFEPYALKRWYAVANVAWYPIYGKMALLGSTLGHYDIGIKAGLGAMGADLWDADRPDDDGKHLVKFCGDVGATAMVYLSRLFALRIDMTVFLYNSPASDFEAPFQVDLGLVFFPVPLGSGE